jgi:hypothetical protein
MAIFCAQERGFLSEKGRGCGCWSGSMLELPRKARPSSAHKSVGSGARKSVGAAVGRAECWSCRERRGLLLRTRAWDLERERACVRLLVGQHVEASAKGLAILYVQDQRCFCVKGRRCCFSF